MMDCRFSSSWDTPFAPLMWLIGITTEDIVLVGRLLGEKLILTEFIGYISLAELKTAGLFASQKSVIMATYLFGFCQCGLHWYPDRGDWFTGSQ
jgi:nucleoside permease NupC